MCVDDYLLVRVQHSADDTTALTASASLASDHIRFFGPGGTGVTPILAPKQSTHWYSTIGALGFINLHTMRDSLTREKTESTQRLLIDHWPTSIRGAKARDVLSMCGT